MSKTTLTKTPIGYDVSINGRIAGRVERVEKNFWTAHITAQLANARIGRRILVGATTRKEAVREIEAWAIGAVWPEVTL